MVERLQQLIKKDKRLAVGLMSGTSLDGVDAALVEIQGSGMDTKVRLIDFITLPYNNEEKNEILKLCSPATSSVDELCRMNVYLGRKMAQAALEVLNKAGIETGAIDFISSHGQTVYHMPEKQATLQIGELADIAAQTGCLTIGDFRPGDMAAGGQGAPLVPFTDYLLFGNSQKGRVLINIGGISNVTIIKAGARPQDVIAFDTGPGNMLIDAIVKIGTNGNSNYDKGGELAARGNICSEWLAEILSSDVYIFKNPPKSTGREYYSIDMAKRLWAEGIARSLSFEDIAATVTSYTATTIKLHFENYIDKKFDISEVLVGGGGVYNRALMRELEAGLKQEVSPMEALNFSSDAKEAIAFAILGNEFLFGNPNNLPSATGASRQVVMGKMVLP